MIVLEEQFWVSVEKMNVYVPFEQTRGWKKFKDNNVSSFLYFVDNLDDPHQACWCRVYEKKIIGRIVDIIGDVQKEGVSRRMITSFWKDVIKDSNAELILYNSVREYAVEQDIGIRCAGFVRALGNRACPLTQIIDLTSDRNYNTKWRRNLKIANKNKLIYEVISNPSKDDSDVVCNLFDELRLRKSLSFSLDKDRIFDLLHQPGYSLHVIKLENTVLCARIVYVNKNFAADVFAANSFEAMNYSATHFLMEQIFSWLAEKGVEKFDFSRISPSSHETNGIYLFKDSAGGYPIQYFGEWIWSKKHYTQFLFCFYNFFLSSRHNF